MQRYCDYFRSRITLELSSFLGISKNVSDLTQLGEEVLVECIRLLHTIDSLKNYKFLPRSLFSGLRENLVGADQLTKAFLKLLSDRNDSWYSELYELQPRQRGNKLAEYYKIVDYQIQKIHDTYSIADQYDVKSKEILLLSAIDTLAMSIARHVSRTSFTDYGEEALLSHILACQECVRYFSSLRIYPYYGPLSKAAADTFLEDAMSATDKWVMALSRVCIEQVGGIFLRSAHDAATAAVQNISHTTTDIVDMLFVETGGWIGGKVVRAYLDRVSGWMEAFCQRGAPKPCEFHRIIRREAIRMVLVTYLKHLIDKYRLNKRFKLSADGEMQVASDLQILGRWVEQNNEKLIPAYVCDRGSYTGSNDVTMLIRTARLFMTSDESNILLCFVESIQHFGLACAPHLYDLARLALKIRSDLPKKVRLNTLASFGCYITKLSAATIEGFGPLSHPHPRISGPSILQELFPNVGVTHCTGKKWSYEKLYDPDGTHNLELSTLVTDACNVARIRRGAYRDQGAVISHHDMSAREVGHQISELSSETSENRDTWQLLDPDHLRMERGPLDAERPTLEALTEERDQLVMAISLLDAAEFSGLNPAGKYSADANKPFVDLYGCSFEELHCSLRPHMYNEDTFRTPLLMVPWRTLPDGSGKVFMRHRLSDDDSVSEDEFTGFDGVYHDLDRSHGINSTRDLGSASKVNRRVMEDTELTDELGDSGKVDDNDGTAEEENAPSALIGSVAQLCTGDEDVMHCANGDAAMTTMSSSDGSPELASSPILPPAKPPKPRKYSKCDMSPLPHLSGEALLQQDSTEQPRMTQEERSECSQLPATLSETTS